MRSYFRPAVPYRTGMYLLVTLIVTAAFVLAFFPFGHAMVSGTLSRMTFVYVHAAIVTSWLLLFIVQVGLARAGRIAWHRSVGVVGLWLTALLVCDGLYTAVRSAQLGGDHVFAPAPIFLAFLLVLAIEVAGLAGVGLAMRNRPDVHKRLMLAAFIAMLPVAVVRIPLGALQGPLGALAITDGTLMAAATYDAVRRGRPHVAFFAALLFLLGMQMLSFLLVASPVWHRLVRSTIG